MIITTQSPLAPQSKIECLKHMNDEEILKKASDEKKQQDFYRKLRVKVDEFIEKHPKSKYLQYVVAAPDFFYLFCRLMGDKRIPIKHKIFSYQRIL